MAQTALAWGAALSFHSIADFVALAFARGSVELPERGVGIGSTRLLRTPGAIGGTGGKV